ncbi:MAG: hypothetical protein HY505_00705 [Candidatus Yanofskybacteria bacterium]|nr:hypothetical protein [Candidatus Yanofskybacteria bacterium]
MEERDSNEDYSEQAAQRSVRLLRVASHNRQARGVGTGPEQSPDRAQWRVSENELATEVSHLVQSNEDKTAPIGWVPGNGPGLFDKAPIWIEDTVLQPGETKSMKTMDGDLNYEVKEPATVCYNGDASGPDLTDGWVQTLANLRKNYEY